MKYKKTIYVKILAEGDREPVEVASDSLREAYAKSDNEDSKTVLRTIFELLTILESYDWSDGDEQVRQSGGRYGNIKGGGAEAHHYPAQSIVEFKKDAGPAISLEKRDHKATPSYGGSLKAHNYRELTRRMLEQGNYIDVVKAELLDIRKIDWINTSYESYDKYDGAICDSIEYAIDYIAHYGVPKGK